MRFFVLFFSTEAKVTTESIIPHKVNIIPSIPMTRSNSAIQSNIISSASHTHTLDDFPDDDFLNDIDIDQIASQAASTSVSRPNQNRPISTNQKSTMLFDDMDDEDFLNIDSVVEQVNTSPQSEQNVSIRSDNSDSLPEPPIYADNYRFKIRGLNLVTIKQLIECSSTDREQRKHFIVRAYIDNVIGKARVSNKQWKLNVSLTDRFSSNMMIEMSFSADVLDKMAGVSGREIHQMHAMRNERPQIEEELEHILRSLSEKLDELNVFMKIEFNTGADYPVIVEIINSAPVLDRKLQEKIQHEKLI